jgi:hypothetical protein
LQANAERIRESPGKLQATQARLSARPRTGAANPIGDTDGLRGGASEGGERPKAKFPGLGDFVES